MKKTTYIVAYRYKKPEIKNCDLIYFLADVDIDDVAEFESKQEAERYINSYDFPLQRNGIKYKIIKVEL